jgi:6-pyruvoyl-tetrahydropterin synthase
LFSEVDERISPIIAVLDHSFIVYEDDPLYEMLLPMGMRMYPMKTETSAENLTKHIYQLIEKTGLPVLEVRLKETTSSEVIYRGL